jgi:chromosome segregation ATPase
VAQLQNQMDALGGPALAKLKATVAELQKGISEAEEEAAKKRAQVKTTKAGAARLEKEAADATAEKAAAALKVDELKAEFASIEEAAAAVLELFTQTQETLAAKAEELAEMKAAHDQMQADTNTIRTVEVCTPRLGAFVFGNAGGASSRLVGARGLQGVTLHSLKKTGRGCSKRLR